MNKDTLVNSTSNRVKAEKRLSGGLKTAPFRQVTRSNMSQTSNYGVKTRDLNSLMNYNAHNGKTNSRKPGNEMHSSFPGDGNAPKSTLTQHAPVSTTTVTTPTGVNSSELNGHLHHSRKEQPTPANVSYSHLVTRPPPSHTLPLPDVTDPAHTSFQIRDEDHAFTQPDKAKKSYHLPNLKTIPSYKPIAPRITDQQPSSMDLSVLKDCSDTTPAPHDRNGFDGTDVKSDASPDVSDIDCISKVFSSDYSSDQVKTDDDFEVRILIDKMYTNEVSSEAGEELFVVDENHLADLHKSSSIPSSPGNGTNSQDLSPKELFTVTVPPPQHFANGEQVKPKARDPDTSSGLHIRFSTSNIATINEVSEEPIPEWKRQIYLNKLKKQKEKEEEQKNLEKKDPKKWEGIPKWRIPMMEKKEEQRLKRIQKFESLPEWKRELLLRRENQF